MFITWQIAVLICFAINASLALSFTFRFLIEKKPKTKMNRLVLCVTVSSTIWSIGMGLMPIQTDDTWAYYWRVFGIFGTFMFMMSVQKTMCLVSEIPKKAQIFINGISYTGLLVFFLYIRPGQTIFVRNAIGTTFYFRQGWVNTIYSLYYIIVSMNIFMVTLHMVFKNKLQRVRTTGKRFIIVELFIFFGAIFDMIIPSLGKPALPGSAITHFWGVFVFWFATHEMYKAKITVANMSEYIYFSLNIPVLIFDGDKKLQIVNDAAASFFSIPSYFVAQGEVTIDSLFQVDEDIFAFEEQSNITEAKNKMDVSCQLNISKIKDKYGDLVGFITIVNDMSEHYLVINKLEEAKRASDAANLSKSLFLANMSHEIRTPMNAILGFSDLALKEEIDSKSHKYFSDIKKSGHSLLEIINQILDISKIELGKTEIVNENYKPSNLFHEVSLITSVQAQKKNLSFEMKIDEKFPEELCGDQNKIREVLINLLSNSVKYTNTGGIIFEVNVLSETEKEAYIQYRVKDTGIGIKEEDIDSVFEKFKRMDLKLNSQTEGTGLGLSITKGIVDLMGGKIYVESVYGEGSVFTVELTQQIVDATPICIEEETVEDTKQEIVFQNIKILEVDDNEINRMLVAGILEHYNIPFDEAQCGQEAVDMCGQEKYDIVLMDQMMPNMDGVEAMEHIRNIAGYEKGSNLKIVALTANVIAGVKNDLLEKGFDAFLGKPIDIDEFEGMLQKMLPNDKFYFK